MHRNRYIYDVMYGQMQLPDYVWAVALTPELQRLREVRLCNINSLCLTGGANINRYEHAVGTAALALECLNAWSSPPSPEVRRHVVLAALMHDIGSAAFGHSVQYVLDARGYEHESVYDMVTGGAGSAAAGTGFRYQHLAVEPIYFGLPRGLSDVLTADELDSVHELVRGRGLFGPLINGTVDLDNIDNVYRLAYHIGLTRDFDTPRALARSLRVGPSGLQIDDQAVVLVEQWYEVRRRLYRYLLLNPDEFSAKSMLQEALELAQERQDLNFRWHDVDTGLITKLAHCSAEVSTIVSRLMVGDLYGCAGLYSTAHIDAYDALSNPAQRRKWERIIQEALRGLRGGRLKSAMVTLHGIKDVNKTERRVVAETTGGRRVEIGTPSRRVLIGVFYRNRSLSMDAINESALAKVKAPEAIQRVLAELVGDPDLVNLEPYGEAAHA